MSEIKKLLDVMARLRNAESGCPWDLQQDFRSIAPYTIEEAYEVADAIERNDMPGLCGELGDLLLQVVFHSRMAEEQELFNFGDVVDAITGKMIRRHPHVFGDQPGIPADNLEQSWEAIKASERAADDDPNALAGIAKTLPALMRAQKLGKRAGTVGFDWASREGVRAKIHEELDELEEAVGSRDREHIDEEFGDLLFAIVNLARHLDVDPEKALSAANRKFERRFREMEAAVGESGRDLRKLSVAELEHEWRNVKNRAGKA